MDFWRAHRPGRHFGRSRAAWAAVLAAIPVLLAAAGSAHAACGAPDGHVQVDSIDDRLDLVLADGRTVRLAGVAAPDPVRSPALAADARRFLEVLFAGRGADLRRLAAGTDRWGRIPGDVAPSQPPTPSQLAAPSQPPAPGPNRSAAQVWASTAGVTRA